jgi:hypothetical protein
MIDIHLLVYAGTLAVFIVCALAVGVLSVIVFTALAAIAGIISERRNKQPRREYADVSAPALITAQASWTEEDETLFLDAAGETASTGHATAGETASTGHATAGELVSALRRPSRPQMIHHL